MIRLRPMQLVAGRCGRLFLLLLVLGAGLATTLLGRLDFVHDTHSLLRKDPVADARQRALVKTFGSEDILLVAWEVDAVTAPAEFQRLREVTRALQRVQGLEAIYSLASPAVKLSLAGVLRPLRAGDLESEAGRAEVRSALRASPVYLGTLYNAALDVVAVAGTLAPAPRAARETTVRAVRAVARRFDRPGHPLHVAGVSVLAIEAGRYAFRDLRRIGLLALAVSIVVLYLLCRSLLETLVAVAATAVPPLLALGVAAVFDLPITALGAALFPVLGVVGITGSVHLLHAYAEERAGGHGAPAAASRAAKRLAGPILLSMLTTAAAFASLQATGVPAFRAGGNVVALGLLLAAPVLLIGLPAALAWMQPPFVSGRGRRMAGTLECAGRWTLRRRFPVVAAGLALLIGGSFAAGRARPKVEVLQAFSPESSIARTYRFLDRRLTATVPLDVVLTARKGVAVEQVIEDLRRFHRRIRAIPGVRSALSLASLVDFGKRVNPVPVTDTAALWILRTGWREITRRFEDPAARRFRIKLRVREATPPEVLDRIDAAARDFSTGRASVTGLYLRAVQTTRHLLVDLRRGILMMGALIFLAVAVVLRSWRLGLAALLPNLLPPVAVFGTLAVCGLALDISAVAVGAVAVGLAVDDTLHVVFRARHERRAGRAEEAALLKTQVQVGRALIVSSVVLVAGLAVLNFSSFLPTAHFGLWTAAACAVALPADLFLLPACMAVLGALRR